MPSLSMDLRVISSVGWCLSCYFCAVNVKYSEFLRQGHCFGGSGYFGIGAPQFFYVDITALTLGKIFRLLGAKFQLPEPIAKTGFPEGASVSTLT